MATYFLLRQEEATLKSHLAALLLCMDFPGLKNSEIILQWQHNASVWEEEQGTGSKCNGDISLPQWKNDLEIAGSFHKNKIYPKHSEIWQLQKQKITNIPSYFMICNTSYNIQSHYGTAKQRVIVRKSQWKSSAIWQQKIRIQYTCKL